MHKKFKWQFIPMFVLIIITISWLILELGGILTLEETVEKLSGMEKISVGFLTVGLLAADIIIPTPSTLIFPLAGNVLGIFWGIILTVLGSMIASIIGYGIGKFGGRHLAENFISPQEIKEMEEWTKQHGKWPVIFAKTMPLMAETISVSAGIAKMPFKSFSMLTFIGTFLTSAVYVIAGNEASTVEEILMITVGGFTITFIVGMIVKRRIKRKKK